MTLVLFFLLRFFPHRRIAEVRKLAFGTGSTPPSRVQRSADTVAVRATGRAKPSFDLRLVVDTLRLFHRLVVAMYPDGDRLLVVYACRRGMEAQMLIADDARPTLDVLDQGCLCSSDTCGGA